MRIYSNYKTTNQLWLPSIPSHWKIRKIKYTFGERIEKGFPKEQLLVSSQTMGVVPKAVYGNRTVEAMKDLHLLKLVREGDFVISLRSFQGGIEYAYYQGIISPAYTIMVNNGAIESSYFKYLAKSRRFIELLQICVTGIREGQNIDYNKLKNYSIPVPPREEQDQIVRFLDWKVSEINKLIRLKHQRIAQLEELKKAVISRIITKGLNPNAKMKDSGVRWHGSIPEHWDIIKLGKFCSFQNGISESGDFFTAGTPFVSYGDVYRHLELPETVVGVAKANEQQQNIFSVQKGDIFFTRTSENIEEIGMAAVCKHTIERAVFSGFIIRCRPQRLLVDTDYMKYYLQIPAVRNHFSSKMNIVIRASLGQNLLKQMPVIIPPIKEQNDIATYLDKKCALIDSAINNTEQQINELIALKTRLIADAVTGRIDVRGIEIPEYEFVEEEVDSDNEEDADDLEESEEQEE